MIQPISRRDAYIAAGCVLAGYAAWAVPAVAAGANLQWAGALFAYSLVAAAFVSWLAMRGQSLLALVEANAALLVVVAIAGAGSALIALNAWQAHNYAPGIYSEDTAYYGQLLWNTLHGNFLSGNLQQARLYDPPVDSDLALHVSPILVALLPFYALAPDPLTLLVVRDIVLVAAAWPLFLLARERLGGAGGVAAALLYLVSPVVLAQGASAFYLLQFAPLPFFYALRAFLHRRFAVFAVATVLALTMREDVAVTFGAFGVVAFLRRYPVRWAAFGCGVPVLWWLVSTMLIQPAFGRAGNASFDAALAGEQGGFLGVYRQLLDPSWLAAAFDGAGEYLWQLVTWSAYAGVLGIEGLLALPGVLMHLFIGRVSFDGLDVYSRFTILPTAALIASAVLFVGRRAAKSAGPRPVVYVAALLLMPAASILDGNKDLVQRMLSVTEFGNDVESLRSGLEHIPTDASVAAPFYALPSLANRRALFFVEFLSDYPEANPQYLLLDRNIERPWLNAATTAAYVALLDDVLARPNYERVWESGDYVLLRTAGN